MFDRTFYDFLTAEQNQELGEVGTFESDDFNADYVISMGGDGTFLKAAVRVGIKSIPLIGINMGRLGFLADVLPGEVETALQAVLEGNYNIEEHTAIQISTNGGDFDGCHYALNDIAVLKRDIASMIGIHTSIDGSFLVNYQADGLIVSTPTGSTAYSLSNGGPIIVPQTRTLCLTPVAPHSLNIRPIVISDSSTVTLEVESRSHNYLVAVDGRSYTMHEGSTVTISKAPFVTRIVKPNGRRYFSSLRDKMMWGADKR
ncbi:NAD kinase [Prevotella sp.]|uniref:NAD kinase n=1 Tax=Prevotella sp. TaxID=59823 RepID=UPI0027E2D8B9|nr:NAD kinase [Prevotella sp.]